MQSVSSKIWTRIAVFISYGDNDYTTGTSASGGEAPVLEFSGEWNHPFIAITLWYTLTLNDSSHL